MCEKWAKQHGDKLYFIARVLIGLFFFMHGAQKLFGWFGNGPMELMSLMGLAGIIEFAGGLMVLLGLFAREAAVVNAVVMLVAYFMAHAGNGWNPLVNQGELALVYFAAFLMIFTHGNGKWALQDMIKKG
jgi:putative oxidoreductase